MVLLLTGIFLIGFMVRIPYVNFPIDLDFGFYTYLAYFRRRGVKFIRDFWGWYTPIIPYLYLLVGRLFGEDVKYVRYLSNFYNLLTILATFMVTNYIFGQNEAIVAALIYAIFSASPYLGAHSCHAEGFYVLPVALAVFSIAHGLLTYELVYFLCAGGFIAVSFLLKVVSMVYFISILMFLLIQDYQRGALYFSIAFLSSIVLYTVFIIWVYWGKNRELWHQYKTRWMTCLGYTDDSLSGILRRFKFDFIHIWRESWSIILLAGVSFYFLTPQIFNSLTNQFLLIWVLSTVFILVSQRVFWMYHFIPLIQIVSILSALAIYFLVKDYRLIGLIGVLSILIPNFYNKINFYLLYQKDKRLPYFQNSDQLFYIPEIAKHIKERTKEDEYIYVWGPFVQIYRLADRMSCDGFLFYFVKPYKLMYAYLFDEIIGGIISKRPVYIVLSRPDFDINVLREITGIEYEVERVFFNRYRVYRLRGKVSKPTILFDMKQEDKIKWLEYLTPGSMNYRIDDYYLKKGMYNEAVREFEEGLKLNPADIWMKLGMAGLLREQKRYKDAFKLYQEIEHNNREKEWLCLEKGITYREMGDMENAFKEFENEERLYPKSDIYHQKGITNRMLRKYKEALKEFNKALAIDPRAEWVHHEMGITYREMGDMENAVKELELEDKLYPGKAVTQYNLYSVYEGNGRKGFAINGYYRFLENRDMSDNFKAGCYFHLGKIYMEDKKNSEAIKFFKRCLELIPEHKKAAEYLKQLKGKSEELRVVNV